MFRQVNTAATAVNTGGPTVTSSQRLRVPTVQELQRADPAFGIRVSKRQADLTARLSRLTRDPLPAGQIGLSSGFGVPRKYPVLRIGPESMPYRLTQAYTFNGASLNRNLRMMRGGRGGSGGLFGAGGSVAINARLDSVLARLDRSVSLQQVKELIASTNQARAVAPTPQPGPRLMTAKEFEAVQKARSDELRAREAGKRSSRPDPTAPAVAEKRQQIAELRKQHAAMPVDANDAKEEIVQEIRALEDEIAGIIAKPVDDLGGLLEGLSRFDRDADLKGGDIVPEVREDPIEMAVDSTAVADEERARLDKSRLADEKRRATPVRMDAENLPPEPSEPPTPEPQRTEMDMDAEGQAPIPQPQPQGQPVQPSVITPADVANAAAIPAGSAPMPPTGPAAAEQPAAAAQPAAADRPAAAATQPAAAAAPGPRVSVDMPPEAAASAQPPVAIDETIKTPAEAATEAAAATPPAFDLGALANTARPPNTAETPQPFASMPEQATPAPASGKRPISAPLDNTPPVMPVAQDPAQPPVAQASVPAEKPASAPAQTAAQSAKATAEFQFRGRGIKKSTKTRRQPPATAERPEPARPSSEFTVGPSPDVTQSTRIRKSKAREKVVQGEAIVRGSGKRRKLTGEGDGSDNTQTATEPTAPQEGAVATPPSDT